MIVSTLPLRRRTHTERTVLAHLRGDTRLRRSRDLDVRFRRLRQIAARAGFEVMPPGSDYVSENELTLLSWIAAAQRMVQPDTPPSSRCLAASVERCAQALGTASLRLPAMTMYISRFREAGAS